MLSSPEWNEIADIYVVANTPAFLVKKLMASGAVAGLAVHPVPALIRDFERLSAEAARTPRSVALRYALLVALAANGQPAAIAGLQRADLASLDWGERIRAILLSGRTSTQYTTLSAPQPPPSATQEDSGDSDASDDANTEYSTLPLGRAND